MVTVEWDEADEHYWVLRRGDVVSRHEKASRAKAAGKRAGKKYDEPVSYKGKRGGTKWIYRPDPSEQFSGGTAGTGGGNGGGLFGL